MLRRHSVSDRALRAVDRGICSQNGGGPITGFEDILRSPRNQLGVMGTGDVHNTLTASGQLAFAILRSGHEAVAKALRAGKQDSAEAIRILRSEQVLAGMRILDLGCGLNANLGRAAQALGAVAFTADVLPLDPAVAEQVSGHVVVDFTDPKAAAIIADQTGGNFDIVTENMIGPVRESGDTEFPKLVDSLYIADTVLANGGFFYSVLHGAAQRY